MSDISPSAIKTDAEFEAAVAAATSVEQIKKLMHDREIQQGLVRPDPFNADILHPVEQAAASQVTHTIEIGGVKKTFTGNSADDLQQQEIAFFKSLETAEPTRDSRGRFVSADERGKIDEAAAAREEEEAAKLIRRNSLEMDFRAGRIDAATFLASSGAIEEHMEKLGISVDLLKQQSAERTESAIYEKSWAEASEAFRNSAAGADWPGGAIQKDRLAAVLIQMAEADPDIESKPKAESIARAWEILKARDAQTQAIARSTTKQELDDALGITDRQRDAMQNRSSGFFGSR